MKRAFVIAALAATLLVPAAAAKGTAGVKLALVPLPSSALPAAARHLPVARDSGVVSNSQAASQSSGGVTTKQLKRLGRVSGYLLDYGNPFQSAGAGVHEIQTEIDSYRSPADARKGLAFWRRDELKKPPLKGFHVSFTKLRLSGLPKPNWAYAGSLSLNGLKPIRGVDAEFQEGRYLLDISVAAGSNAAAARLVPTVAGRLDQRFRLALAGRLRAGSVKLPAPLKPGPPSHGPKPANLVLKAADGGAGSQILHRGYSKPKSSFDQNALSVFDQTMGLGGSGTVQFLSQEVLVGGSKLEVEYFAAIAAAGVASGSGGKATAVDLGDVGDNAQGELLKVKLNGRTVYEAAVILSRGPYLDFLVDASASTLTASDVHNLARLAARRLNAGFGG